jgi:outer membrane protein assembly factor BamB
VIEVEGRKQIVSVGANSVVAYNPYDGSEIWMVRHSGYSTIPRPVYAHGLVFICSSFDQSRLLAIRPTGQGDVTNSHVEWETQRGAPHSPSLLVIGDELYAVSDKGILTCFDAKTGDVRWTHRVGGNYSASPLFADGKIYLQSEEGVGTVVAPGAEYEELAKNDMHAPTLASYAVDGKALLIRTETQLFRIEEQ